MPRRTKQSRFDNIKSLGSDVYIIDGNYDDASNLARENAQKFGWILIQDSSWKGYEKIIIGETFCLPSKIISSATFSLIA